MRLEQIKEIANAVLYEGYLLYPYRPSAIKNRQRWTFGVVYPREYSEANGSVEPWTMQTECLVRGTLDTSLDVHVRFLHLLVRSATATTSPSNPQVEESSASEWGLASRFAHEAWEEGVEREVNAHGLALGDLLEHPKRLTFEFPGMRDEIESPETPGNSAVLEQKAIAGSLVITAVPVETTMYRLNIQIENRTPGTGAVTSLHNVILLQSFVSTHTILQAHQGAFLSLMDPPEELKASAQGCHNLRTWPVLVGSEGEDDAILSSPIILYDYPQIAPESPGSLFDGTEIDEILTLRILTLTDEEKQEMRRGDARVREILERTEALTPEQFMKMHGTIRNMRPVAAEQAEIEGVPTYGGAFPGEDYPPPVSVRIAGKEVKAGDNVRLHPKARADAFDMLLDGKTARVEMIHQDFENRLYVVVTLDDDPGREQWDERVLPGHRFFFFPEEVELLEEPSREEA